MEENQPRNNKTYKFRESMIPEVHQLARFGLTNEEIAEFYKIQRQTFEKYCHDIPELSDALQRGRLIDSLKVVDSLHRQALGYETTEYEEAEHIDRHGDIHTLKKKITKYVQPNVTAAIYLLKTRHGDKWMDIIRTEKTQNLNIMVKNVDFSDITTEELMTLKKLGVKSIPEEFRQPKALPTITERTNKPIVQDVRGN